MTYLNLTKQPLKLTFPKSEKMIINIDFSGVSKTTVPKSFKKYYLFESRIKMINLSLEELKVTAKLRKVKDYKYNSKDKLTKIPSEPKSKIRIEKIRKN